MKKEIIKELEKPITLNDLFKAQNELGLGKDKILAQMVEKLFDEQKLLMIARLDTNLAYYIVKHLIIDNFYMDYYSKIKIIYEMKKIDIEPYYEIVPNYDDKDISVHIVDSYKRLINEILQITISFQGKGREEILQTIKTIEAKILQDEMMHNKDGFVQKLIH